MKLNSLGVLDFTEKQQVFINSSYSGHVNSKIKGIDQEAISELIKEELKKVNSK